MQTKRGLSILVLWLFSLISYAQMSKLSDNPEEFIAQVRDMLLKVQKPEVTMIAEAFLSNWNGGKINSTQKAQVIKVAQKMQNKRCTPAREFAQYFATISNALTHLTTGIGGLERYLTVCDKVLDKYQQREIIFFFERIHYLYAYRSIYHNRFNRLKFFEGSFELDFLDKPIEEVKIEADSLNPTSPSIKVEGAVVKFNNIHLHFVTPHDSTGIRGATGTFIVSSNIFTGKGGRFDWTSLGWDANQVYVDLNHYTFDVSKPSFSSKNSTLTYTPFNLQNVKGEFSFLSKIRKNADAAEYPRFTANENIIDIPNFARDVSYHGGFSLEGKKIYSTSKSPAPSVFTGKKFGELAFRVISKRFLIEEKLVTADKARMTFFLTTNKKGQRDSLFHSSVKFRYVRDTSEMQFIRDRNSAAGSTPFINTSHKFFIDADVVRYNITKDSLDIFMFNVDYKGKDSIAGLRPAFFESEDFFDKERFNNMIGVSDFHPIKLFTNYARKIGKNEFFTQEIARDFKRNEGIIKATASSLMAQGYIDYDEQTGLIRMNERIFQADSSDIFHSAAERVNFVKNKEKQAKKTGTTVTEKISPKDELLYDSYDHDYFLVESRTKGRVPNASMKLRLSDGTPVFEMIIRGITQKFPISAELNVYVKPDSTKQKITIFPNRSIYMEKGEITVGKTRFIGQNFFLNYNDFSLEMPIIDKIIFVVEDTTEKRKADYGGEIKFQAGSLNINDPLNKAGKKKGIIRKSTEGHEDNIGKSYESFPRLVLPEGGTMYFYNDFRQNYAYDSTRSYFEIYPVDMDSLDIKPPSFKGKFKSNIFPTFEDFLMPMPLPDQTMGFFHTPPKEGYDLYPNHPKVKNAKAKFTTKLIMSKEGLYAGAEVDYLTTKIKSPKIFFMPDSASADNTEFVTRKGKIGEAEYAEAEGKMAQLRWSVRNDKLVINNSAEMDTLIKSRSRLEPQVFEQKYREKLFTLYKSSGNPITLKGDYILSAEGEFGNGILARKDFTVSSNAEALMRFGISKFSGSNVENLKINSAERDPYKTYDQSFYIENEAILDGINIDFDFDLEKGQSRILPNPDPLYREFAALSFPYAKYKTTIKDALWDLNKQIITLTGDTTSRFTSTKFGQGALTNKDLDFRAEKGVYDIKKLRLDLEGVPYINSADARIIPDKGKVTILKDAEMQELKKARLQIDTLNRYHNLFDGNIKINARVTDEYDDFDAFEGDATYQFVNVKKDTFNIKFDRFRFVSDEESTGKRKRRGRGGKKYTVSQGTVKEEDKFYITTRILYKGQVKMFANRRNLALDGAIKLDLQSVDNINDWIPYKSDRGDSVSLEVAEKQNVGDKIVSSGLHFSQQLSLYGSFLNPKRDVNDQDIILASGILDYTPSLNEFKIEPKAKREGKSFVGNQLILDDSKGSIYVEGKLNLLDNLTKQYLTHAGTARVSLKDTLAEFELVKICNFQMPAKAAEAMQKAILAKAPEKPFRITKDDQLTTKLAEIVGDKPIYKYLEESILKPVNVLEISSELKKPLVFSKINMKWSEAYKTLHSVGKLRLLGVNGKVVNEEFFGFVEIRKATTGDGFSIYLEIDPDLWYYFEVDESKFQALSSDANFNNLFLSKNTSLASEDKKEAFINKFRALYGGVLGERTEKPAENERKLDEENKDKEKETEKDKEKEKAKENDKKKDKEKKEKKEKEEEKEGF
ncbi:MAG: hypothetical protein NZ551_10085 [Microscillaceae bacterium]|nr:hypothetical protein [Microscillaceae bacterium]MDW8461545.1 hypothetical protein [Cytophagales bacterium]